MHASQAVAIEIYSIGNGEKARDARPEQHWRVTVAIMAKIDDDK